MASLHADNIIKRFSGIAALKGVSFDLRPGEVHALCGENGAGKSTLIKVLSGLHPWGSYEGDLKLGGELLRMRSVSDAESHGIAVIYQELALVPEMTVAENIYLGREPELFGLVDWQAMHDGANDLLAQFGIEIDSSTRICDLGVGLQQLVEIAKALAKHSQILILDEPTAALSETEVDVLLAILRELRSAGVSCIYISHKIDEAFAIADRITVLRDGESIVTVDTSATTKGDIIRHMVGREITELYPRNVSKIGEPLLTVDGLDVDGPSGDPLVLRDIGFEVRAGEVLGIGGLMGAGRTQLLMHVFGAWGTRRRGSVILDGRPLDNPTPECAIKAGLVLVSEDRKRYGLVLEQDIGFNLSLSSLAQFQHACLISGSRETQQNQSLFDSLQVKATGLDTPVGSLSGGNQQKIVLGKALMTRPKVILLDEPTRGIDVGAKVEVYQLINALTARGQAVVLVSSELPELMGMSDRIAMLSEGRIGGTFDTAEATPELLMAAALKNSSHKPSVE